MLPAPGVLGPRGGVGGSVNREVKGGSDFDQIGGATEESATVALLREG